MAKTLGAPSVKLAFLWHMHQPYYKDDLTGEYLMPWVFLHALKDYCDMPWHLVRHKGIKASFNLVPSLLMQLEEYKDKKVNDLFLRLLRKEVKDLLEHERHTLFRYLFSVNPPTMIDPLPRYRELFSKKEAANLFEQQEILDLEVLFLLSWCGNYLRKHNETVKNLLKKGLGYSEEEKLGLIDELHDFIETIIPLYKNLWASGQISLSVSALFHPILPLLLDMQNAANANGNNHIPNIRPSFKQSAKEQVAEAVAYFKAVFGKKPSGFWPPEGAISSDVLELLAEHSLLWACADEGILFKSLGGGNRFDLYRRYLFECKPGKIMLFFRDRNLSDLIGFSYAKWDPKKAAKDFIDHLDHIRACCDETPIVSVILDGENAWEYYPNHAYDFFEELYTLIAATSWCETVTFDEAIHSTQIPQSHLEFIAPGSWINADFSVWVGEAEENRAWELLSKSRDLLEHKAALVKTENAQKAYRELLIAEGSDWFWWYGSDRKSAFKDLFDLLFRRHLINIHGLLGQEIPRELLKPLWSEITPTLPGKKPITQITPKIDGVRSDFFEWTGSGVFVFDEMGTMAGDFWLKSLQYGFDERFVYLAVFGDWQRAAGRECFLELAIKKEQTFTILLPVRQKERIVLGLTGFLEAIEAYLDEFFEIRILRDSFGAHAGSFELTLALFENQNLIEQQPFGTTLELALDLDKTKGWFV